MIVSFDLPDRCPDCNRDMFVMRHMTMPDQLPGRNRMTWFGPITVELTSTVVCMNCDRVVATGRLEAGNDRI